MTNPAECEGCFNPIDECSEYGSCLPRFKAKIAALESALREHETKIESMKAAINRHLVTGCMVENVRCPYDHLQCDCSRCGLELVIAPQEPEDK